MLNLKLYNATRNVFILSCITCISACDSSDSNPASSIAASEATSSSAISTSNSSNGASTSRPSGPPVSTAPPNASGQTPAFPEQTRAPEISSDMEPVIETIASNLGIPWGFDFLPDGRLIVTIRDGQMHIVTLAGDVSPAIQGVPSVFNSGQGGLLDISLAPDFSDSRYIYFSFSEPREDNKNATAVARARLSTDESQLEDVEVIFQQQPAWNSDKHFGSRLVWSNQGQLYVTLGERSLPEPRQYSQDLNSTLGKVVRINSDGTIPSDNPFVNEDGMDAIWSYGHRNVQGATLHPTTGKLWTIEHGPQGGDEINIPQPGKNYGWPIITYGENYNGAPIGEGITAESGMEQPVYYWDPVIAPSDMTFYTGDEFPQWQGNLLVASMKPGGIVRLLVEDEMIIGEERLLQELGRVRDVAQGPDGMVYASTDTGAYSLVRIVPASQP